MSELVKPSIGQNEKLENQCQNVSREQKTTSDKRKSDSNNKTRRRMNDEWIGKTI